MNKKLFIGIFLTIAIIVLLVLVWFFLSSSTQKPTAVSTNPAGTLPISSSVSTSTDGSTAGSLASSMSIATRGGGMVVTKDFIHNGVTLPDTANKGRYLLVGNLGYCVSNPKECQAGSETDFSILYDSNYNSLTIDLLKEPLGQVRLKAEQFLTNALGINQTDMCRLNYYIGTTYEVNSLYSGKNLGFSFCPEATALPK